MKKKHSLNKKTNLGIFTIMLLVLSGYSSPKLYAQDKAEVFPKIKGTVGIVHPIVTFTSEET
ncbi:hypothetical protein KMY69_27780, partial [Klebsiella pneumoniae]|uniref:hypothetical protein n=1 Tax=Klebsiella pneumoniae TaxID=573 RepID=UPI00200468A4